MISCNRCKILKKFDDFNKNSRNKNGYQVYCRLCQKEVAKIYYEGNGKNVMKKYHESYYIKNKDKFHERTRRFRKENPEAVKVLDKRYHSRNQLNINYRLKKALRTRLNSFLRKNTKPGSAIKDLGCTIEELRNYLESKFQTGMTWENYGEWQIDHIYPLSKLDLTDRTQFLKGCHYTNLQPLWKIDNIKKYNKVLE